MAEGMWEVARDDNVSPNGDAGPYAALLEQVIMQTPYTEGQAYPVTYDVAPAIEEAIGNVIENLNDNDEEEYTAGIKTE
jgi:hypothetical protein